MTIKRIKHPTSLRFCEWVANNKERVKGKVNEEYKVWIGGREKNGTGGGGGGGRDLPCIKKSPSCSQ